MILRIKESDGTIKFVDHKDIPNEACGLCEYGPKTISISSSLDKDDSDQALMHELGHAIGFEYGELCSQMEDHERLAEFARECISAGERYRKMRN